MYDKQLKNKKNGYLTLKMVFDSKLDLLSSL